RTATVLARHDGNLMLIEGAKYEYQNNGVLTVSIVDSSLHSVLHGANMNGLEMLNFEPTKIVNSQPHALWLKHPIGRNSEKLFRYPGCVEEIKAESVKTYRI
ncbi:hypothetical protein FOL47_004821, partial [Perkinsus chesapeaki]